MPYKLGRIVAVFEAKPRRCNSVIFGLKLRWKVGLQHFREHEMRHLQANAASVRSHNKSWRPATVPLVGSRNSTLDMYTAGATESIFARMRPVHAGIDSYNH